MMQRNSSSSIAYASRSCSFHEADDYPCNRRDEEQAASASSVHDGHKKGVGGRLSVLRQHRLLLLMPCALLVSVWNVVDILVTRHHENPHNLPIASLTTDADGVNRLLVEQSSLPLQPVIDILSIGSLLRPQYQESQRRTFAQHKAVRHFVRIDERNDTDASCYTDLTLPQVDRIIDFCAQTEHQSYISQTLRQRLFEPKKHVGWMCAQKRPLDGLYQLLQRYVRHQDEIPDFVFIIDDDTFINMDRLVPDLVQNYAVELPFAVAGCNFEFLKETGGSGITFPYGGYGSFLTKAAIERLLQPFYCDGRDEHSNLGCWRLNRNALGEKDFYTEGMSVLDLMQAYGAQLKFTAVDTWNKTGYCLHSDHALAYFINFYHIVVPHGTLDRLERPDDKIRRRHSYIGLVGDDECTHERTACRAEHRLCHYTTPEQMDNLYAVQQDALRVAPVALQTS